MHAYGWTYPTMKYWLLTYHAWPVLEYVAIAAGAGRLLYRYVPSNYCRNYYTCNCNYSVRIVLLHKLLHLPTYPPTHFQGSGSLYIHTSILSHTSFSPPQSAPFLCPQSPPLSQIKLPVLSLPCKGKTREHRSSSCSASHRPELP